MKNICFLYRLLNDTLWSEEEKELNAAIEHLDFPVYQYRSEIPPNSLVFGRYSVLPFRKELEKELALNNSTLINSHEQFQYIANFEYYDDLEGLTPKTWFQWANLPEGSYVVKGKTNSRKFQWKHQMFAETREDVPRIVSRLMDDSLVRDQGLVVREYVPLVKYAEGINDLPITNEWRFFCLKDKIICYGYYWGNEIDCMPYHEVPQDCLDFVYDVMDIVKQKTNFYVIDVGEKQEGGWTVIELNSGEMSGIGMIDPQHFYYNFNYVLQGGTLDYPRTKK